MVFYVSLFLISLLMASVVVWLYRSIREAADKKYQSILPSARDMHSAGALKNAHRRTASSSGTPTPWGWKQSTSGKSRVSGGVAAKVASGSSKHVVGWPYRDEPFAISGSRTLGDNEAGSKVVSVRKVPKGGIEKPWGW